ncbi:DUF4926 domain-containing protein [Streptomyces sp. NPDC021212]|uniref:DUF4926 domain-containing protein n=1 Tax=Streptomyces sp. NPDC021212 TaxID=3365118 RepID=UPI00378C20A0
MTQLFDVVQLVVDIPEEGLRSGMTGTVVDLYDNPPAYEVEFSDDEGRTLALLPLRPEQIRPVSQE